MPYRKISQIFTSFQKLKVLIIGDVMEDNYLWGEVERISPEAPVPIVSVNKKENRLGGAANVALNILKLGAQPILCSVIGNDSEGRNFIGIMKKNKMTVEGILQSSQRKTTVKTRVISSNHQLLRYDDEITNGLNEKDTLNLIKRISTIISTKKIDVVIFQDYNKGVLTEKVIHSVIAMCNRKKIPVAVDPKKQNFLAYENVTLFKPNLRELKEALHLEVDTGNKNSLEKAIKYLENKLHNRISLLTLAEKGIFIHSNKVNKIIPAHIRNIADVSGAGDTVISVASLCLALQLDEVVLAALSNLAGGLVCEQVGVVPVNRKQLMKETEKMIVL